MKNTLMMLTTVLSAAVFAETEVIDELALDEDKTVDVAAGSVKRIEYLSGSADATLVKTGEGALELAIVGNAKATIRVEAGMLKSVRPAKIAVDGNVYFHLDANDADSLVTEKVNGTNFVTRINDAAGGELYATKSGSRPNPFIGDVTLNGLPVLDFGPYSKVVSSCGSAMALSSQAIINELFYVWQDHEGTKDAVPTGTFGPNAVNMRFSYRGKGGAGADFVMYNNAHGQITDTVCVDGVRVAKTTPIDENWHTANWYAKTAITSLVSDYGFYGFGWCANGSSGYGGVRIAEVIACSDALSDDERTRVLCYLKRKWFGGDAVKKVVVRDGATLDTSATTFKVDLLDAQDGSVLVGDGLRFSTVLAVMPKREVSGVVAAQDRGESMTPDLSFSGDAEVTVGAGTGLVDKVSSGTGVFRKSGAGVLKLAFPNEAIGSLAVCGGELVIDPLVTPGVHVHVDATRRDTMTIDEKDGVKLVTQWRDVNGNGRYLSQSTENYAYGTKGKKNYPFLTESFTNGFPVVDFGTFSDSKHVDGWGAEMDVTPKMASPFGADNPPISNIFAVWGDREEVKDIPLVDENTFRGPCLFGNGGAWYRGYGGGGQTFYMRAQGDSNMGEDNWIDGKLINYVTWMNTYEPPERLFVQNTFIPRSSASIQQIGGNATETTSGYVRGVAGGLRVAEVLAFRHVVPTNERFRIDRALGAKWFNRANPYAYGTVSVAAGAALSFPYADVTATNLAVSGTVTARAVEAKNLTIENGTIVAPLTVAAGGTISVTETSGAIPCLTAQSVSFGGKGTIVLNADVGSTIAEPIKVIAAMGGPAKPQRVNGWKTATGVRAVLVRRADGYYVEQAPGFLMVVE